MATSIQKIEEVVLDFYSKHGDGGKKPTIREFRAYIDKLGIELEYDQFLSFIYLIGLKIEERQNETNI